MTAPAPLPTVKEDRIAGNQPNGKIQIRPSKILLMLGSCVGFALAGALTRFHLVAVETRLQLVAFWIAALALHLIVRRSYGPRLSRLALALNGIAATIAIIATRWWLEGLPSMLR